MNLLVFINSLSSGGAERVTANLANYWAEKGWRIAIVTLTGDEQDFYPIHPAIQRIPLSLDADSHGLLSAIKHNYQRVKTLRKILKQQQPDVALAMMTTANILLAIAAKGLNTPVIGAEHTHPPMLPLGFVWEQLRRRIYRHLNAVTALTTDTAIWLRNHTATRYVIVIPNAVTYPIVPHPHEVSPNISSNYFHLIAVGRLDSQKGFERLLPAFAELVPHFPNWRLTILGEGECRNALEKQCSELGLEQCVSLPGVVGNLGEWYEAADLYVMTSLLEGLPNALIEAMAYGLPVISVDCGTGPRDIIRHEVDGILVPQDNPVALVSALSNLMGSDSLRQQYASRAIEVRERFSMERISSMWENLFEKVKK